MKLQKKIIIFTPMILILVLLTAGGIWFKRKYATSVEMDVHLKEYSQLEYPEDPANRSVHYAQYSNRNLKIVKKIKHTLIFLSNQQMTIQQKLLLRMSTQVFL